MRALSDLSYLPIRAALPAIDLRGSAAQVAETLASTLADDGAVLAVDDLHWCDTDTLALLVELVQRHPVVGVVRADPGPAAAAVAMFEQVGEVLELGPLDDLAARSLVRQLRPGAPTSDIEEALRQSRGNPLDLVLFAAGDERGPDVASPQSWPSPACARPTCTPSPASRRRAGRRRSTPTRRSAS